MHLDTTNRRNKFRIGKGALEHLTDVVRRKVLRKEIQSVGGGRGAHRIHRIANLLKDDEAGAWRRDRNAHMSVFKPFNCPPDVSHGRANSKTSAIISIPFSFQPSVRVLRLPLVF